MALSSAPYLGNVPTLGFSPTLALRIDARANQTYTWICLLVWKMSIEEYHMFGGDGMHAVKRKVGMIQSLDLSRRKKKKRKKNIGYSPPFEKLASQRKEKKISELISAFINTY
jgi:hypothetical protein